MTMTENLIESGNDSRMRNLFNVLKANRRKRVLKNKHHILAAIKPGEEDHPLIREFLGSLPPDTQKVLDSFGYVGSLVDHVNVLRNKSSRNSKDERHFVLYRASDIEKLASDYFTITEEASIQIVPDRLSFQIIYYGFDGLRLKNGNFILESEDSIDTMISLYEKMSANSAEDLLTYAFNHFDNALEQLTRKTWFGLGQERKFPPTHVFIGLENTEQDYLISVSNKEPVEGRIKGKLVRNIIYK